MFKNITIKRFVVLVAAIVVSSCMSDEGNYEYQEINEVTIDGLEASYEYLQLDNFNITPELSFTKDSGNYAYSWEALQRNSLGGDINILLSTNRNLTERITLTPGFYNVYYTVKDLVTNVAVQYDFELRVSTSVYEGWLLLNDNASGPRLDMISKLNDEFNPLYNVTEGSGLQLSGTPNFVYTYSGVVGFYGIYVSTSGNGTVKLQPNDFSWTEAYTVASEFVIDVPNDLEADGMAGEGYIGYVNVDGSVYHYNRAVGKYYGVEVNHVNNEFFEASPQMLLERIPNYAMLYDNTNKRFVRNNRGSGVSTVMPNPIAENMKFDYTTGKDLVFMVNNNFGNINGTIFAILSDATNGKRYLAIFTANNGQQRYYGEVNAPDFNQATTFAVSPNYGYLFYAVGSKVYQYDFISQTSKLMIDKGSEEISLLKFQSFYAGGYDDLTNKLIVCSYTPSNTENSGSMELYDVPPVNGQITLDERYTGFGKIISIDYRER